MNVQPLQDRVLVEPIEGQSVTKGGIIIPDSAKEKPKKGKVIAAGIKCVELKEGDTILYGKFAGNEIEVEKQHLLVMREADVIAIIPNEDL